MSLSFSGIALVTGAGSGIGRALSIVYSKNGMGGITLADRNAQGIAATERLIKDVNPKMDVLKVLVNVADQKSVENMVSETVARFGGINYAANVAGLSPPIGVPTSDMSLDTYDEICNVNSRGVFLCMRAELEAMAKQQGRESSMPYLKGLTLERGVVVNVASLAGIAGVPNMSPYASSKHAVVGLSKTAALEYARAGIRVNAVCPGYVETPMISEFLAKRSIREGEPEMEAFHSYSSATNPMGRIAKPQEVAEAIAWLSSAQSSYINGIALPVDGGLTAATSFYKPL